MFGISVVGIILAKITSARLSYHVQRMFGSDVQNRTERICAEFGQIETILTALSPQAAQVFPGTPGAQPSVGQNDFILTFGKVIHDFHTHSTSACRYFETESNEVFFLEDAPAAALTKAAESVEQALFVLSQIIIGLAPAVRTRVLGAVQRRNVADALAKWQLLCKSFTKSGCDQALKNAFSRLDNTASKVAESFFSAPETESSALPDQTMPAAVQP